MPFQVEDLIVPREDREYSHQRRYGIQRITRIYGPGESKTCRFDLETNQGFYYRFDDIELYHPAAPQKKVKVSEFSWSKIPQEVF